MKRLLTAAAVMLLIVCMTLLLGSCGSLTPAEAKDDPHTVVSEALELAGAEFFTCNEEADKLIAEAMTSGAVTVSLKGNDAWASILGEDFKNADINATIYSDILKNKYALGVDASVADLDVDGVLYMEKDKVALKSKSILGTELAYFIVPSTLADDLGDSEIGKLLFPDEETKAEMLEYIDTFKAQYEKSFEKNAQKAKETTKKFYDAMKYEVTTETIDKASIVVVTLKLNNETIKSLIDAVAEAAELDGEMKESYDESLESFYDVLGQINIDSEVKIHIDAKTRKLYNATLDFTMTSNEAQFEGESVSLEAEFNLTDDKLTLDATVVGDVEDEFEYGVSLVCEKEIDGDHVNYILEAKVESKKDGETEELGAFSIDYDYDMTSGDFELDVYSDELEFDLDLEGKLTVEGNSVTVVLDEIGTSAMTLKLGITLKYEKGVTVPTAPADAKDLTKLTEEELEALMTAISENSIFVDQIK